MDMSVNRRGFFGAAAGAVAATQFGMSMPVQAQRTGPFGLLGERAMPSLAGAAGWINTAPLTPEALRGKVVLVEFWTYTCINWLRTHPYVRAWGEKYKDLVVLGVHTPEFPFEGEIDNVRRAVRDMRIHYPVLVDSDYAIWRAFRNQYWPAFYFVDAQGRIRHHQSGKLSRPRSGRELFVARRGDRGQEPCVHRSCAVESQSLGARR
jgi:thiol-disulfide isomerase/thioredoxin